MTGSRPPTRNRIGDWWVTSHDADADERIEWSRAANHLQGRRQVGGKLFLTNARLLFNPHHLDHALAGRRWSVSLEDIETVDTEPRLTGGFLDTLFGGGLRNRLRIDLVDESADLFVVNDLGTAVTVLTDSTDGPAD